MTPWWTRRTTMLEIGQPLHAFDYDLLRERAGGKPTIITRTAYEGEKIALLDGSEPQLDTQMELVTDTVGPFHRGSHGRR